MVVSDIACCNIQKGTIKRDWTKKTQPKNKRESNYIKILIMIYRKHIKRNWCLEITKCSDGIMKSPLPLLEISTTPQIARKYTSILWYRNISCVHLFSALCFAMQKSFIIGFSHHFSFQMVLLCVWVTFNS